MRETETIREREWKWKRERERECQSVIGTSVKLNFTCKKNQITKSCFVNNCKMVPKRKLLVTVLKDYGWTSTDASANQWRLFCLFIHFNVNIYPFIYFNVPDLSFLCVWSSRTRVTAKEAPLGRTLKVPHRSNGVSWMQGRSNSFFSPAEPQMGKNKKRKRRGEKLDYFFPSASCVNFFLSPLISSSSHIFLQFELPSLPQSSKAVKGCLFC